MRTSALAVPHLRLLGPTQPADRVPVFTFVLGGLPATVAQQLDRRGIAVRADDIANARIPVKQLDLPALAWV
jgi:selenocysteine lyase/cysteine desulfurase